MAYKYAVKCKTKILTTLNFIQSKISTYMEPFFSVVLSLLHITGKPFYNKVKQYKIRCVEECGITHY